MAVLNAQGTTITFNAIAVGGAVSYTFGDGEASDIDVTTLASTAKEWRQGLQDFGNLTIELMRDPADPGQAAMETAKAAQAVETVTIALPTTPVQTATFQAYCKSISSAGGIDAVVTGTATLKVTGNIVWTTAP